MAARTSLGIFCLLIFGCSSSQKWTIEEYEGDAWTLDVFKAKVLTVLDDPKTEFCQDRNCIPKEVKQAYTRFFAQKFSTANPDEPFNCSCVQDERPNSRLLFFAKRGPECVWVFKRGGRACNFRALYFKMEESKLRQMHVLGGIQLEKEGILDVKNWIQNLKNDDRRVGDWRHAN